MSQILITPKVSRKQIPPILIVINIISFNLKSWKVLQLYKNFIIINNIYCMKTHTQIFF